jgi:hypothetical protein
MRGAKKAVARTRTRSSKNKLYPSIHEHLDLLEQASPPTRWEVWFELRSYHHTLRMIDRILALKHLSHSHEKGEPHRAGKVKWDATYWRYGSIAKPSDPLAVHLQSAMQRFDLERYWERRSKLGPHRIELHIAAFDFGPWDSVLLIPKVLNHLALYGVGVVVHTYSAGPWLIDNQGNPVV